jgi:serine protease AprX
MMKNSKFVGSLAVLLAATAAFASSPLFSPNIEAKIAPFVMTALSKNDIIPIIVKMKKQADLKSLDDARVPLATRQREVYDTLRNLAIDDQKGVVSLLQSHGAKFRRFYISNMVAVWNANADLVKAIAARGDVEKVYGNPSVKPKLPSKSKTGDGLFAARANASSVGDNIHFMNADLVWTKYGKQGEGIVVAGQDTGVQYDHPALAHQYRGYAEDGHVTHDFNWHDSIHQDTPIASNRCGYDLDAPCDDGDHGSHTMGTMIGSDGGENVIGMAPKAKWIACRNMDGGTGSPASYIECFEWMLAPYKKGANPMTDADPTKAPNIINNSWGCPESEGCASDEIEPALVAMKAAGVLVVASAGNDGPSCTSIDAPPAWHTGLTFEVGAYDHRSGTIADFSSRGPSKFDGEIGPDGVAPGVDIRSSIPKGDYAQFGWSGTSMAGPHVAGAAALLWSVHPELIGDIAKTTELLKSAANPKTTSESCGNVSGKAIPNNTYGMGLIDIAKAIAIAGGEATTNSPPTPTTPLPSTPPSKKPTSGSSWPSGK